MEAKPSKSLHKKQSISERASPNKKIQGSKKKKKHRKKSDIKDAGKTSTSPEVDVALSDTADVSDPDKRAINNVAAARPVVLLNHSMTKYSEAIATLKQNRRKQQIPSQKLSTREHNLASDVSQMSTSRFISPLSKVSPVVSSSKGANMKPLATKPSPDSRSKDGQQSSLRWEYQLSDDQAEHDRLRVYKQNRRLRYLASANQNYTEWLATGITGDGDAEVCDTVVTENSMEQSSPRRMTGGNRPRNQHKGATDIPANTMKTMTFKNHNQDIMLQC